MTGRKPRPHPQAEESRCHVLPLLQHSDKLIEPVPLHLGSLPKGLHFCSLCLPAFLFWGVREPGARVEKRGHVKFKDIRIPIQWRGTGKLRGSEMARGEENPATRPRPVYEDVASGAWVPARVKWLPLADGP